MASWESAFGGTYGGSFRLRVDVDLIGQNEEGNYSIIRYNSYIYRTSTYGGHIWNYDRTYGNTNINGYNPQRSIGSYDFPAGQTGNRYNLAVNEQYTIYHDSNGNANPFFGANFNLANSPYLTTSGTGGNYSLPSLYRYAAPNYVEFNGVTDVGFNLRVVSNRVVDRIGVQIDGGAWQYFDGSTTDRTMSFGNKMSGRTYSVRISLRRQASGFTSEYGNYFVTTADQNKFFDIGDF